MKRNLISSILLLLITLGCVFSRVPIKFTSYESSGRAAKPSQFELNFLAEDDLEGPYKVIGLISVRMGDDRNPSSIVKGMLAKAKKVGGDALINLEVRVPLKGITGLSKGWVDYSAKVIVFNEQETIEAKKLMGR